MPNTIATLLNEGAYKLLYDEITEKVHDDIIHSVSLNLELPRASGKAMIYRDERTQSYKMGIIWATDHGTHTKMDISVSAQEIFEDGRFHHIKIHQLLSEKAVARLAAILLDSVVIKQEKL